MLIKGEFGLSQDPHPNPLPEREREQEKFVLLPYPTAYRRKIGKSYAYRPLWEKGSGDEGYFLSWTHVTSIKKEGLVAPFLAKF